MKLFEITFRRNLQQLARLFDPVAVPEFFCSLSLTKFDRCHSLLLAYSATGSARKRPHLSTSPYKYKVLSLQGFAGGCMTHILYHIVMKIAIDFLIFSIFFPFCSG